MANIQFGAIPQGGRSSGPVTRSCGNGYTDTSIYDAAGNLVELDTKDANGNIIGAMIHTVDPSGLFRTIKTYDGAGNQTNSTLYQPINDRSCSYLSLADMQKYTGIRVNQSTNDSVSNNINNNQQSTATNYSTSNFSNTAQNSSTQFGNIPPGGRSSGPITRACGNGYTDTSIYDAAGKLTEFITRNGSGNIVEVSLHTLDKSGLYKKISYVDGNGRETQPALYQAPNDASTAYLSLSDLQKYTGIRVNQSTNDSVSNNINNDSSISKNTSLLRDDLSSSLNTSAVTPDIPPGGSKREIQLCKDRYGNPPLDENGNSIEGKKGYQVLNANGMIVGGGFYGADGTTIVETNTYTEHKYANPQAGSSPVWISISTQKLYDTSGRITNETLFDDNGQQQTRTLYNTNGSVKAKEKWNNGAWQSTGPINPDNNDNIVDPIDPNNTKTGGLGATAYNTLITSLSDPTIKSLITNIAASGQDFLTYKSMKSLMEDTSKAVSTLSATQFKDLQTFISSLSGVQKNNPYIYNITNALVNGDQTNAYWTGGVGASSLGNLQAGSNSAQLNKLIGKWFGGTDNPSSASYQTNSNPLFFNDVQVSDVNQGATGDCYFLAALVSVAKQNPDIIKSMFIDNGNGTYGVRFYRDGQPDYVTVDSQIATRGAQNAQENWVQLAEKAYVKFNETYTRYQGQGIATNDFQNIEGGFDEGLKALTGETTKWVSAGNYADKNSWIQAVEQETIKALANHQDVLYASYQSSTSGGKTELTQPHMYSVTGWNADTKKFTLRNPWGNNSAGSSVPEFEASAGDLWSKDGSPGGKGILFISTSSPLRGNATSTISLAATSFLTNQPAIGLAAPSTLTNQPAIGLAAPSTLTNQPAIGLAAPSTLTNQPAIGLAAPSTFTNQLAIELTDPSIFTNQPAIALTAPSLSSSQTTQKLPVLEQSTFSSADTFTGSSCAGGYCNSTSTSYSLPSLDALMGSATTVPSSMMAGTSFGTQMDAFFSNLAKTRLASPQLFASSIS